MSEASAVTFGTWFETATPRGHSYYRWWSGGILMVRREEDRNGQDRGHRWFVLNQHDTLLVGKEEPDPKLTARGAKQAATRAAKQYQGRRKP